MVGGPVNVQARSGCVCGHEVWLAQQQGGIAVYDSRTHQRVHELAVATDAKASNQIHRLVTTHRDVWAATVDGELLCVDTTTRKVQSTLRLPGAERKAALTQMDFTPIRSGGTGTLTVASAAARVFVIDPATRKLLISLGTFAPCTAVAQCFHSMVVAGDENGALYAWDLNTATGPAHCTGDSLRDTELTGNSTAAVAVRPTCLNQASRSKVRHMLFEPETETLWVARENGNLDVYALAVKSETEGFTLERRAASLGLVTGMTAISGKVVVTTFEKKVVTLCAESAAVLHVQDNAHKSFIHGVLKVSRSETATLWSLGNDDVVREHELEGFVCACNRPSRLTAHAQASLALTPFTSLFSENVELGIRVQSSKLAAVAVADDLRKAREEAQELRLRVMKLEECLNVKDAEVGEKTKRLEESEAALAKLTKEVTDISTNVMNAERDRVMLQADLGRTRDELTQARTEASNRSLEKYQVEEELSRRKTETLQVEQRLRDTESKLASAQAENARLCQAMGSVATAQSAEKELQNRILQSGAQTSQELQDARQLNRVLSAVVASMDYTIRRREEEDKDIVTLLNAYRRKVADHVTDPFLSALLVATMVRRPERFDMECDEATKAALLERNGPFIQFVHSLRETDPEAYEKLMGYLQQCASANGDQAFSPEARQLLDKFVSLAAQEGALGDDAILALKRSIPSTVSAASPTGGVSGVGLSQLNLNALTTALGNPIAPAAGTAAAPTTTTGAGNAPLLGTTVFGEKKADDDDVVGAALLRELRSQRTVEETYVKEQRAMFEFILKTRRALIDGLVLLQKRTMSAQQVVEALTANAAAAAAGAAAGLGTSFASPLSPTKAARATSLQVVFLGIARELAELTSNLVTQYLTNSEKQRLNVQ